jgi:hypothetical protein
MVGQTESEAKPRLVFGPLIYLVNLILIGEVNLNIGDNSVNSDPKG